MSKTYGKKISPILKEIADSLWEIEARDITEPYGFSKDALRSATKIFSSVAMDRLWKMSDGVSIEDRARAAENLGRDIRDLILKHLEVDMHKDESSDEGVVR